MLAARRRKVGRRRKGRRRKARRSVGSFYHSGARGYAKHAEAARASGVAAHYHSGARGLASHYAKKAKRRGRRRKGGAVTAASILRGARSRGAKLWICRGPKRTGCGGGKKRLKGSRVVGVLR